MRGRGDDSQYGSRYLYGMGSANEAPGGDEECRRLRRYIATLQAAHGKQIDALLAQLRQSGRQIAELRIEAGLSASTETRRQFPRVANISRPTISKKSLSAPLEDSARDRRLQLGPAIRVDRSGRTSLQRNNQGTIK